MNTYVIFDRETGEILQTHVQTEGGHGRPEDVLKMISEEGKSLDILAVDELAPGAGYKVDLKTKKLVTMDPTKARGIGGGVVQSSSAIPRTVRTVFFNTREKKDYPGS